MIRWVKNSFLAVFMVSVIVLLAGCTSDEAAVFDGLKKTAAVNSATVTTNMSVQVDHAASEALEYYLPTEFITLCNNYDLSKTDRFIQDRSQNQMRMQSEYNFVADDNTMKFTYWVEKDQDKLIETFKVPTLSKVDLLPFFYNYDKPNADYYVVDVPAWNAIENNYYYDYVDYNMFVPTSYEFGQKYLSFIENYMKTSKLEQSVIALQQKDLNGAVYQMKLSDGDLKKLIRSVAIDYAVQPEARVLLESLTMDLLNAGEYSGICSRYTKRHIQTAFSNFWRNPIESTLALNAVLNQLEGVRILGDKGIKAAFTVNKDGFVSKVDFDMDISLDLAMLAEQFGGSVGEDYKTFNFKLHYDRTYSDINAVDSIDIPVTTEANSIDVVKQTITAEEERKKYNTPIEPEETPRQEGEIVVRRYGGKIEFKSKPALVDGILYVPLAELVENYYGTCWWDDTTKTIQIARDGAEYYYTPGDSVIYADGFSCALNAPTKTIDGIDYVPLKSFVAWMYTQTVTWNEEEQTAYIK